MKKIKWLCASLAMCLVMGMGLQVHATENQELSTEGAMMSSNIDVNPIVVLESYTVDSTNVVYGEENMIHLTFKNESKSAAASNILVSFSSNNQSVSPVYGAVNNFYIDKIAAGAEETVDLPICILSSSNGYVGMQFAIQYTANNAVHNSVTNVINFKVNVGTTDKQGAFVETTDANEDIFESSHVTDPMAINPTTVTTQSGLDSTTIMIGVLVLVVILALFGLIFGRKQK